MKQQAEARRQKQFFLLFLLKKPNASKKLSLRKKRKDEKMNLMKNGLKLKRSWFRPLRCKSTIA